MLAFSGIVINIDIYIVKRYKKVFQQFFPTIKIRFLFGRQELNLATSKIPEEIETMQAITDCLSFTFRDFKYFFRPPIEIQVEGDYMDYSFKVIVHSRALKKRIDAIFEDLNTKLSSI